MDHAIEKLRDVELPPGYPHRIWELRPRAGRSRHRAFFRVIRGVVVIGAVGPEALVDPRGFRRSVRLVEERLDRLEARAP